MRALESQRGIGSAGRRGSQKDFSWVRRQGGGKEGGMVQGGGGEHEGAGAAACQAGPGAQVSRPQRCSKRGAAAVGQPPAGYRWVALVCTPSPAFMSS